MRRWCWAVLLLGVCACGDDGAPGGTDGGAGTDGGGLVACVADEECDDGRYCNGVERCDAEAPEADSAGCVPGDRPCLPEQACVESDDACRTRCERTLDADDDGHDAVECGGDDCDDGDADRYPGNRERCDPVGHDEDCDATTYGEKDLDLDGHDDSRCCNVADDGTMSCGTDCVDSTDAINPDRDEQCDLFDNDCDGMTDEGVTVMGYEDLDADGDGNPAMPLMACPFAARFAVDTFADCDDSDLNRSSLQVEFCDGVDNDCDGTIDENPRSVTWYRDEDGDLYGNGSGGTVISCTVVPGYSVLGTDCDDMARGRSPVATEQCNGLDDDCNGRADFIRGPGDTEDDDGDTVADGMCPVGMDCDDNSRLSGGVAEICMDGFDNDCDGTVDEMAMAVPWYPDLDGDGFGDERGASTMSCAAVAGHSPRGGDCDDSSAERRPGARDGCNAADDDCDGAVDEDDPPTAYYVDVDGDGTGVDGAMTVLSCGGPPGPGFVLLPGDCAPTDAMRTVRYADSDGDGVGGALIPSCTGGAGGVDLGGDCNDTNPAISPMASEVCDGMLDEDCDENVDEGGDSLCSPMGTMGRCIMGGCVIDMCTGSFGDCDGDTSNGCEADTMTDPTRCGDCFTACGTGADCTGGVCARDVVELSAGSNSTCARRMNGRVICWGDNTWGITGVVGPNLDEPSFSVPGVSGAVSLGVGSTSACTVDATGVVTCWGLNANGELGRGTRDPVIRYPAGPALISNATTVDVGGETACAIRTDGGVSCWGRGDRGQIGNGGMVDAHSPTNVRGIGGVAQIATGDLHVCARLTSGQVWCWGEGSFGQIGDLSMIDSSAPRRAVGIDDAIDVDVDGSHSCAVLMTGAVRCWGLASSGQLGRVIPLGTDPMPTDVPGVTDATTVAAGWQHTCVTRSGGTVLCTGADSWGQLGDGLPSMRRVALGPVAGITDASRAVTMDRHTCALRSGGLASCWGLNASGQLGARLPASSVYSPVRVVNLP